MTSMSKCLVLLCLSAVLLASTGAFAALDDATITFIRSLGTNLGTGWDSTADPCTYKGITCAAASGSAPQTVEINLSGGGYSGMLLAGSGTPYITKIDLSNNVGITGNFPSSWATMTAVTDIDLSSTQLTGQIPNSWNGMTALQNIKITDTKACYRFPTWSGDSLTSIVSIDFSNNYIYELTDSGFSAMATSKTLTTLNIGSNPLCGCVSAEWMNNTVMYNAASSASSSSVTLDCLTSTYAKCNNVNKCVANGKNSANGVASTVLVAAFALVTMAVTVAA